MGGSRPRVIYWNNIPSPYVVERFSAVAARGTLDFEAWFCAKTEADRSWLVDERSFNFRYRYVGVHQLGLPGRGRRYWGVPRQLLRKQRTDLLISLYADPAFATGWWVARQRGIRTAFRYLPTYDAWIQRTRAKEVLKRYMFAHVDGFKVSGADAIDQLRRYRVPVDRIHVVTQSIDVHGQRAAADAVRPERDAIRSALGVSGVVFLYVGRLWMGKGLEHLLRAYAEVAGDQSVETSLLIVGDGPDEAAVRRLVGEYRLPRVVLTGFVQSDQLPRLRVAADVFVFPTLGDPNGLVVEEAMAAGLPIVSSDAAGDIRGRVEKPHAGIVVRAADPRALAAAMASLAADPTARDRMGLAGASAVLAKGHEQYAADFEAFVGHMLSLPRRSGLVAPAEGGQAPSGVRLRS